MLVARTEPKLKEACKELHERSKNPNIDYVIADFSNTHKDPETFYRNLYEKLKPHNVSVLINNMGIAHVSPFTDMSLNDMEENISLNIYPVTYLTHAFLPDFLKRFNESGQKSLLINVSSVFAHSLHHAVPVHASSKHYI